MAEYEKTLQPYEVRYGLVAHHKLRQHFGFGDRLELIDQDGRVYRLSLHSTISRIDGLTKWHRRYETSIGDKVTILINADNRVHLRLIKSGDSQILREQIRTNVAAGDYKTIDDLLPPSPSRETLLTNLGIVDEEMHLVQPSVVEHTVKETIRRDTRMIHLLKELAGYRCQFPECGVSIPKMDGSFYIEVAHLQPVRLGGKSVLGNLLVLCPNHHKEFDYGSVSILEQTIDRVEGVLNGKPFMIELRTGHQNTGEP